MKRLLILVCIITNSLTNQLIAQYITSNSEEPLILRPSKPIHMYWGDLDKIPDRLPYGGIRATLLDETGYVRLKIFSTSALDMEDVVYNIHVNYPIPEDQYLEIGERDMRITTGTDFRYVTGSDLKSLIDYKIHVFSKASWTNQFQVELIVYKAQVTGLDIPGWSYDYEGNVDREELFYKYYDHWDNYWWELFEEHVTFDSPHNMYYPIADEYIADEVGLYISNATGFVGVGIDESSGALPYEFVVDGALVSDEMVIKNIEPADYVFRDDYPLLTLKEVDKFIEQNHHLPNVPNQKDAIENDIGLGELNMKMLEKVEELTLYTIQQQKMIEELRFRIQEIKNQKSK